MKDIQQQIEKNFRKPIRDQLFEKERFIIRPPATPVFMGLWNGISIQVWDSIKIPVKTNL